MAFRADSGSCGKPSTAGRRRTACRAGGAGAVRQRSVPPHEGGEEEAREPLGDDGDVLAPPSLLQRSKELLLGRDVLRLALALPTMGTLPRGDGSPVVLVPGFGTGDSSLVPMRLLLRHLGHDVRSARLGRTGDDVMRLAARVRDFAAALTVETGRTPALVGWSIGGVLAREAARDAPEVVRRVVTMGTPVEGGPSYTALAGLYSETQRAAIRADIAERNKIPIRVPVTAIWSPNDGIVTPAACLDDADGVEHVRVTSTHLGMGVDPVVWRVVAECLAAPD